MRHFRAMMQAAKKDGATREEILEVCGVAIAMGGDPSYTYTAMVRDAVDALSKEKCRSPKSE